MKKYFYFLFAALGLLTTACSNDEIDIETAAPKVMDAVTMTVSPKGLFSSYNYTDTYHNVDNISDEFRTFNSEAGGLIQVRTLFYDRDSRALVDSVGSFVNSADNDVVMKCDLPTGDYYAISVVSIATGDKSPLWYLVDREKLETSKLEPIYDRSNKWNVMSVSTEKFTVTENSHLSISTNPTSVGVIIYHYMQNFQYKNEQSTSSATDNNIRKLALYTRNMVTAYKLNPEAINKYEYLKDAGSNMWYIQNSFEPTDFDDSWTFFKSNLYGYSYMLAPEAELCFGYVNKGATTFNAYGQSTYRLQSGKVYLAYWDYFKVGNPYFGIADNNHWNKYNAPAAPKSIMRAESMFRK